MLLKRLIEYSDAYVKLTFLFYYFKIAGQIPVRKLVATPIGNRTSKLQVEAIWKICLLHKSYRFPTFHGLFKRLHAFVTADLSTGLGEDCST